MCAKNVHGKAKELPNEPFETKKIRNSSNFILFMCHMWLHMKCSSVKEICTQIAECIIITSSFPLFMTQYSKQQQKTIFLLFFLWYRFIEAQKMIICIYTQNNRFRWDIYYCSFATYIAHYILHRLQISIIFTLSEWHNYH